MADDESTKNLTQAEQELLASRKQQAILLRELTKLEKELAQNEALSVDQKAELSGRVDDLTDRYELLKAAADKMNESLKLSQEQGKNTAQALGGLVGMTKDYETSMLGSIEATLTNADAQKKFGEQMKKTFSIQNMSLNILNKITQATTKLLFEQDKALVAFNLQTGAARLYGSEIVALEERMYSHGVTMDDASESWGALTKNVYALKQTSGATRKDLSDTTAILNELGVSADVTADNVQFMTRSLGMSVEESTKFQREMFVLAQDIGMPPAQMAEDFKSAAPKLAAFGKEAGRMFTKLATNARAAGMEVEQLLGIVEQFDTFEGAAQSVGKLNALLGGPFLNSMEMVMATDPTERMRLLSGALNDAGKSFDQMSYYERKAIASAAGFKDVDELAKVMANDFGKVSSSTNKTKAEIEALAAQTKEYNEIGEKLNQIMRMFAITMAPVVGWIKGILQGILDLNEQMGGWFIPILGGIAVAALVLIGVFKVWTAINSALVLSEVAKAVAIGNTTAIQAASIPVMAASGTAAGAAATPMYAFAGAALAVGAAFFLVGAGVGLAAYGMSLFMTSLAKISPADMMLYGLGLYSIASGMMAIAAALLLGGGWSLGVLTASVFALGLALRSLNDVKLNNLSLLFEAIAKVMNSTSANLKEVRDTIGAITDDIATMPAPIMRGANLIDATATPRTTMESKSPEGLANKSAGASTGAASKTCSPRSHFKNTI